MRRVNKERLPIFIALILFWSLILGALSSCGTVRTAVVKGERRVEWSDRSSVQRDSIYVHDSVCIRDRTQRDTIYLLMVDNVYVETQVKKTSAIADVNSTLRVLGCTAIIIAVIIFILKIRKRWM